MHPMTGDNNFDTFFEHFTESIKTGALVKLTLSLQRHKNNEIKNVFMKPVTLKSGAALSVVYRYPTKDITKNYTPSEALNLVRGMLATDFGKADMFTTEGDFHLTVTKTGAAVLLKKKASVTAKAPVAHDKERKRLIAPVGNIYLHELGITTADGKVKSDKQDKYRQINKYTEIVEGIVKEANLPRHFTVADMGSGKGYLTFALYDHLSNGMKLKPEISGVELRQELVDICNRIAEDAGFKDLHFNTGSIETTGLPQTDMLIALHACDTATDEAIYRGITGHSQIIICAPCCHKQIRKQMQPANELKSVTKFGILEERQAEILTDTIRALVLEAYGYKTKVFEFISTEHTPKNLLIVGVKSGKQKEPKPEVLEKIKNLKALFNIQYHQLEKLMGL